MSPICPNWLLGALMAFVAVLLIGYGIELWRHPDSLKPGSYWYQLHVSKLHRYRRETWKKRVQPYKAPRLYRNWQRARKSKVWQDRPPVVTLTREDIQDIGIDYVWGGVIVLVVGIVLAFVSWPF